MNCFKCGNCCRGKGYVRLKKDEVECIASYLNLSVHDFTKQYTKLTEDRKALSLIDSIYGECIFLTQDASCVINDVKPLQCRTFPDKWTYPGFEKECAMISNSD